MPFNEKLFEAPSSKGDLAQVALSLSLALDQVVAALNSIKAGNDLEADGAIREIEQRSTRLFENFKDLSGWREE